MQWWKTLNVAVSKGSGEEIIIIIIIIRRRRIGNPNTNSENIQSRYRNGIWHWKKKGLASNEKWQTTHDGRSRTTKSSSDQNTWSLFISLGFMAYKPL